MAEDNCTGESSISEYVEDYRDLDISFDRMHFKEVAKFTEDSSGITDGVILGESFVDKYRKDLQSLVMMKTFTKDEIFRYRNNPWALSYDLYGTVEYWQLLLDLNDMVSAVEFTLSTIKVYDESLIDTMAEIMAAEEQFINTNEEEVNEALGITMESLDEDDDYDDDE